MELHHIELENLKTTTLNVRKVGGKNIDDLLPSIRSLGVLQPLLVRKNCEPTSGGGYEIVAGQRRYHAVARLAEESAVEPLPCIVMQEGDDAKAIEASLAENIARLPMDEIDQYKAFSALVKQGKVVEEIANQFGITERLVKQRLAIANLISPILTAYRKEQINAGTIRSLTLATKAQQKEWWALFQSDKYAPQGHSLKEWLFGGANIRVEHAIFEETDYDGNIVSDLFSEDRFFDDVAKFWELQNTAIANAKERYLENGWSEVIIFDVGDYFSSYEYCQATKKKGGKIYVQISYSGEVKFHEGYLTKQEAKRQEKVKNGEAVEDKPERPELTKVMQNYLELHRHAAVRAELLNHQDIALRLCVAQIIAGSALWAIHADPQKANSDAIKESLSSNTAEDLFAQERLTVCSLLDLPDKDETAVPRKEDWNAKRDVHAIFSKLLSFDDETVNRILTFVVAETLPCGSGMVEALGSLLSVDMSNYWSPGEASTSSVSTPSVFFELLRDKEAINAILKQVGGKRPADANVTSTAKVQKQIIRDYLDGTRSGGKTDWQPRYMDFPFGTYTKRGGIDAVTRWKEVKKHYAV